ncbi:TIGR04255 family protein [Azonexus fungiphilus]|uniref:TIGR04255 family protein n=1 Tax=Azonexus fungiphilus TaxID=146940 RepID=UPI00156AC507|nr:TIGR04255 family protein [Azonexus fungiphilus]NHC07907.1 TIGR04255 family protein [Azonexus fungiphilus]
MGTPLKNPPVYFTICQVRFNQLLKLAEFLPVIQEAFSKAGYPAYETQSNLVIQMVAQEGKPEQLQPLPTTHNSYQFGSLESTHLFMLDSQALTLQSTKYGCFEAFSAEFLKGLYIVHEALQLSFTERIGLRYLDRVIPLEGDNLEQYLVPEVHGLVSRLGGQGLYTYSEAMTQHEDVKLRARVVIQGGGLAFPPDVQPNNMVVDARFHDYQGVSAILDNDGFVEKREAFSIETVSAHLNRIHDIVDIAFKATVTNHAFEAWDR